MDPTFIPSRSRTISTAMSGKKAVAGMLPRTCKRESTVCRTRARRKVRNARGMESTTASPTPTVTRRKLIRSVHGICRASGPSGRSKAKWAAFHPATPPPTANAVAASTVARLPHVKALGPGLERAPDEQVHPDHHENEDEQGEPHLVVPAFLDRLGEVAAEP